VANDRLIFEVVAEGKGLKVVQKDVDAVASGVERTDAARKKAGKGQDAYNKREKALYQSGLSASKGFSKMNQTIGGGSSGLVGAYATLAANVFAATAAFQVLKEAAAFENLISGLEAVGAAAGRNLTFASEKLVEVSGFALSTERAMRSMALGVSSGFSTEQMEKLTTVARGASLALGRDMGDAMDRLTRGAAKLEPEILDELGIMVRLDDATERYATTIGKSVGQLSQFERRQAFLNAILEQGDKKFGQIAESIDTNPYDRLAASLANLQKVVVSAFNKVLGPMISLLADNMGALAAVVVLFGSTIVRTMIPALNNMSQGMANNAQRGADLAKVQAQNLDISTKLPKAYREAIKGMDDGTISAGGYKDAMNSLNASDRKYLANMSEKEAAGNKEGASFKKSSLGVKENNIARVQLVRTYKLQQVAAAKQSMANAVESASQQGLRAGFKALSISVKELSAAKMVGVTSAFSLRGAWAVLQTGALATAGAVKVLGASLMAALGWISLVASLAFMLYEIFKDQLFPVSEVEENAAKVNAALSSVKDTAEAFQKTTDRDDNPASVAIAGYKALQGVLIELEGAMLSNTRASKKQAKELSDAFSNSYKEQVAIAEAAQKRVNELQAQGANRTLIMTRGQRMAKEEYDEQVSIVEKANKQMKNLQTDYIEEQKAGAEELKNNLLNNLNTTITNIESSDAFGKFSKHQIAALDQLKKEIDDGTVFDEADIKKRFAVIVNPIGSIVSAFEGARDAASQFNAEVNKLDQKAQTPYDNAIKAAEGLQKQFTQLDKEGYLAGGLNEANLPEDIKEQRDLLIAELKKQLGTDRTLGQEEIDNWISGLNTARNVMISTQAEVKKLQGETKRYASLAKQIGGPAAMKAQLESEKKLSAARLAGMEANIQSELGLRGNVTDKRLKEIEAMDEGTEKEKLLAEFTKRRAEVEEDIAHLRTDVIAETNRQSIEDTKEQLKLDVAREEQAKRLLQVQSQGLAAQKQALDATMKLSEMEMQLENARNRGRSLKEGIDLRPGQQLRQFQKFAAARMEVAIAEFDVAKARIKIERALLNAKTALLKKEVEAMRALEKEGSKEYKGLTDIIDSISEIPDAMDIVFTQQERAADLALKVSLKSLSVEKEKLRIAGMQSLLGSGSGGGFGKGGQGIADFSNSLMKFTETAEALGQQAYADNLMKKQLVHLRKIHGPDYEMSPEAMAAYTKAFNQAAGNINWGQAFNAMDLADKIAVVFEPIAAMFDQLSTIQTDKANELAAYATAMRNTAGMMQSLNIEGNPAGASEMGPIEALNDLFAGKDRQGGPAEAIQGIATGIGMVAQGMANIYGIKAAQTADSIAQIDKEIAATKKLGLSKEEKEKRIMALEKKKEALERKKFAMQKKMMLAQAIAATAVGVAMALTIPPPVGWIMAGITAAMGAAQIAVISGLTYQGGGSSSPPGKPSAVGMGERSNKVDLSRNNVAGELAYMRGERGTGTGASNFTPAFTGYRHRATGGAAYVVGEQGPELFVPEVPGQIVANDEIGAGAAPVTANFTINTIDASTMEQTLNTQRGNIINMIREAANSSGEPFLESVDTLGLQTEEGVT